MHIVIAASLAGKRIAITGSTGFVGTALVERLLRSVPDCELILLVRDGRRTKAARRTEREILKNDAFDRLRELHGGPEATESFAAMTSRRITTIAGDVGTDGLGLSDDDRATFATADVIIHSAATVSFDSPLDSAIEINLLGPTRIAETCHDIGITPHLVAVSTCYVAGNRRGTAPEQLVSEGPFDIGLDWRAEVRAARRGDPGRVDPVAPLRLQDLPEVPEQLRGAQREDDRERDREVFEERQSGAGPREAADARRGRAPAPTSLPYCFLEPHRPSGARRRRLSPRRSARRRPRRSRRRRCGPRRAGRS